MIVGVNHNKIMENTTYTITELAKEFDVTTRAIRFYEDQGLLTPLREGRRRVYRKRDRVRLKLILRGKRLGFSLGEIKELFDLYDNAPSEIPQLQRFINILGERKDILEQQKQDIEVVLQEITAVERQCRDLLSEKEKESASRPRKAAKA